MKNNALIFLAYGGFLILMGLAGFMSNPEKAKTALLSGGLFGGLSIAIGILASRGWNKSRAAGLGLATLLAAAFSWRSVVSWGAVLNGQPEKMVAAVLISVMLAATIVLFVMILRPGAGKPDQSPAQEH